MKYKGKSILLVLFCCYVMLVQMWTVAAETPKASGILDEKEQKYINEKKYITVGFYQDTYPLAEVKEHSKYEGVYIDLLDEISKITGVKIKFYAIDRSQYGFDLLKAGVVDFVIGSSDKALTLENKNDFSSTIPIMDYYTVAVSKKEYQFSNENETCFVLTNARKYWESYIKLHYPKAKIIYKDNSKECLKAIEKGIAQVTFLNTNEFNYQSKNPRFKDLMEWENYRFLSNMVMVMDKKSNPLLLSIMNKGITKLSQNKVQMMLNYHLNKPYESNEFSDLWYEMRTGVIISLVVLVSSILAIIYTNCVKKKAYGILKKKNQELQEANQIKTAFLSRISHDMRTPLNGILGIINLMSDKVNESKDQEYRKEVDQLYSSSKYLLNLIDDTLDVSKIEKGNIELYPEVCNGRNAFDSIVQMTLPLAKEKNIELNVSLDGIPFCYLYIDIGRSQQLFMNILTNAVKFTPNGGKIDIIAENISEDERYVVDRYIIKDSGIGMKEEFIPHLFEPFSQEDMNRTSIYKGSGLGMSITKNIIDLMDGEIEVHSKVNEGTEVIFTLKYPKATEDQIIAWRNKKYQTPVDYETLKNKRVLLCEDHPLNIQIAVKLLEKKGIIVEVAEDGMDGVDKFFNSPIGYYDAVLMDIRMPRMDGIEATKEIRSLDRVDAIAIPIIAMTANVYAEDKRMTKKAGMNAHLAKPINPHILYETLARWMNEHQQMERVETVESYSMK